MNIVIDTNIIVSAVFFGGVPKLLTDLVCKAELSSYANAEIIDEYKDKVSTLQNDKIKSIPDLEYFNCVLSQIIVKPKMSNHSVCVDESDNKFIDCAIDNKCIYIVSGDKHLLDIKKFENVQILKVADFLAEYNNRKMKSANGKAKKLHKKKKSPPQR